MTTVILIAATVFCGMGVIASIAMIGKPRKPLTHGIAILNVICNLAWAIGFLYVYAHGHQP